MQTVPPDSIKAEELDQQALAALIAFYRDAGVDWLVEDAPVDHKAAFAARQGRREAETSRPGNGPAEVTAAQTRQPLARERKAGEDGRVPAPAAAPPAARSPAVPDQQAFADARSAAAAATSIADLARAFAAFEGCNLKASARSTAFIDGNPDADLLVIGSVASAEDDREGKPFSGPAGQLLDRMLKAIDLDRDTVLLGQIVPWRPPGSRQPSQLEAELCRPFTERLIALSAPRAVLILGNFAARMLIDRQGSIPGLRGRWVDLPAGAATVPGIATFHPAELIQAPLNKGLAWRDLLMFRMAITHPAGR